MVFIVVVAQHMSYLSECLELAGMLKVSPVKQLMYKQITTKLNNHKNKQYYQGRFALKEGGNTSKPSKLVYTLCWNSLQPTWLFLSHTSSLFRKLRLNACYLILKHICVAMYFKTPFLLIHSADFLCLSISQGIHFLEYFYAIYKPSTILSQDLYSLQSDIFLDSLGI